MLTIIVKLFLISFGIIVQDGETSAVLSVAAILSALTFTALNQYLGFKRFTAVSSAAYILISVFYPAFAPFIPLFCCDLISVKLRAAAAFAFVPLITQLTVREPVDTVFLFVLILLAVFLQYSYEKIAVLSEENKRIRDDSAEFNRMLTEKNRNLIEKQNYEIHLVTLKSKSCILAESKSEYELR